MKDSIFGGINAFASVILADSTGNANPSYRPIKIIRSDSEDEELKKRKILKGPEARLNQLRISPATYCNEPEGNNITHMILFISMTHQLFRYVRFSPVVNRF